MEVDGVVATLLRRVCTLESQMNEIRCFLPKFMGFLTSNEGVSNSALNIFNEKSENSTTKTLTPCESIVSNNAVVETWDDSFMVENAPSPIFPHQSVTSTICKNDDEEGPPPYENGEDTFTHFQLRVNNDCNGFCSDTTTTEVAALNTFDGVSSSNDIFESPDDHLNSEQQPEPQPSHAEKEYHMEKLKKNLNPFYPSSLCCVIDEKVQDRINFPSWKDAWVAPPLENSITSDENNHIRLSDSIDMLSAMGGRDGFGLELGRMRPSPMTPCFRQQQHASVQTQTDIIASFSNCHNIHNDGWLSCPGGCCRSESSIKVLKTPASIIRHGLVGRCDRIISDSSNRDQRRLVYGNNHPVYYDSGGRGNVSVNQEQQRQWGEKQQHTTITAAAHHSCCMADTFANAEAQRVEHQHVHWPDECGGRLVKNGGKQMNSTIVGGGKVNFSLPETPGLSPVCGVGNKEGGGDINFSPSTTPFTPIMPVESSEIRDFCDPKPLSTTTTTKCTFHFYPRSFTSADTDADDGGMTAAISPGFEYTEKLDPAKSLFISSPTPAAAPEGGSSTGVLSSPSCSIFETMSVSTNMSHLPPLSQSPPPNRAAVTGVVDGGGGNVHVNCINHDDKEFVLPLFVDKERHMVQPTTVVESCGGIESATTNVKHLSNQQNVMWHFMPKQPKLVRSQSWGYQISSVHDQPFMGSTPSTNIGEYERSWDGIKPPSLSKMSSEFWRRRLATHGGGSVNMYNYRGKWR